MHRNIRSLIICLLLLAAACSNTSSGHAGKKTQSPNDQALTDVKIESCGPATSRGLGVKAKGTVTNHSSATSDYSVTVAIDGAARTQQLDVIAAKAQHIQPKQSEPFEIASNVLGSKQTLNPTCRVVDVVRVPSVG